MPLIPPRPGDPSGTRIIHPSSPPPAHPIRDCIIHQHEETNGVARHRTLMHLLATAPVRTPHRRGRHGVRRPCAGGTGPGCRHPLRGAVPLRGVRPQGTPERAGVRGPGPRPRHPRHHRCGRAGRRPGPGLPAQATCRPSGLRSARALCDGATGWRKSGGRGTQGGCGLGRNLARSFIAVQESHHPPAAPAGQGCPTATVPSP